MIDRIPYTQTWEDTDVLRRALRVDSRARVLAITSAGGAPVSLLCDAPASLVTIDANIAQTRLVHLIAAAAEVLLYERWLGFIGIHNEQNRSDTFRSEVSHRLDQPAGIFWRERLDSISAGVIHTGKLERYFRFFAQHVVHHLVARSTIGRLLTAETPAEQARIYSHSWDTWRWRLGLRIFFSRAVMKRFGRDRAYFDQTKLDPGQEYWRRAIRGLTQITSSTNWMLEYILTGHYQYHLPPVYSREAWLAWRRLRSFARILTDDLNHVVATAHQPFTHVHLSDIFEGYTVARFQEFFSLLATKIVPGGRVCFWRNLATPPIESITGLGFRVLSEESAALWANDRGFFYKDFILLERS